jgi:hypothetical protein
LLKKSPGNFRGFCHRNSPTGGNANGIPEKRFTEESTTVPLIEAFPASGIVTVDILFLSRFGLEVRGGKELGMIWGGGTVGWLTSVVESATGDTH